jgi:S-formylglutathione hydrolase FrmB
MGASMGGLNALSLYTHLPQFFTKVASLCPPIYDVPPHSPMIELFGLLKRSGADLKSMITHLVLSRKFFKNDEEWSQFSPYEVLKNRDLRNYPPLYITGGLQDELGNFSGVEQFVAMARSRGARLQWRASSGGQCAVDAPSLAQFFQL